MGKTTVTSEHSLGCHPSQLIDAGRIKGTVIRSTRSEVQRVTSMESKKKQQVRRSRTIAFGEEAQRDAIHQERLDGTFDGKAHFESLPIVRAMAKGFPRPNLDH